MSSQLSHFDEQGASRMVDVGEKPVTKRIARASGLVRMSEATLALIRDRKLSKGDVLEVARLAGIMAAKRTSDLIPLCHPLPLDSVSVEFSFPEAEQTASEKGSDSVFAPRTAQKGGQTPAVCAIRIETEVQCTGKTGVEMEALAAVSVAALTIYDMCKSAERGITIEHIRLEEKSGGRSGHWKAEGKRQKAE